MVNMKLQKRCLTISWLEKQSLPGVFGRGCRQILLCLEQIRFTLHVSSLNAKLS